MSAKPFTDEERAVLLADAMQHVAIMYSHMNDELRHVTRYEATLRAVEAERDAWRDATEALFAARQYTRLTEPVTAEWLEERKLAQDRVAAAIEALPEVTP